ncbi:hypothetical protein ACFL0Z_02130 [Patescibacteria group bacterium]
MKVLVWLQLDEELVIEAIKQLQRRQLLEPRSIFRYLNNLAKPKEDGGQWRHPEAIKEDVWAQLRETLEYQGLPGCTIGDKELIFPIKTLHSKLSSEHGPWSNGCAPAVAHLSRYRVELYDKIPGIDKPPFPLGISDTPDCLIDGTFWFHANRRITKQGSVVTLRLITPSYHTKTEAIEKIVPHAINLWKAFLAGNVKALPSGFATFAL